MDCVSVCPNDALYFGFGKPSFSAHGSIPRTYSLSWPEEAAAAFVFFVSYLAVWDVYQLVPMLMALGIASVTTFLALRSWKLLQAKDLTFYKFRLKSSGKIKRAGFVFLGFAFVWIGLNIHCGWVRYHESAGSRAYERVQVPDELALAQTDPGRWLKEDDRRNVEQAKRHLNDAFRFGLFVNNVALPKLAWMEFLSGDADRSVDLLSRASSHQYGQARALSLYYKGAILNRTGRYEKALASLDEALEDRSDLILARVERGESLWQLGRRKDAVAAWSEAARINERIALASYFLSGAAESKGDSASASAYEKQGDAFTPSNAYFHWMLGIRLRNVGMHNLSEKHFAIAARLNRTSGGIPGDRPGY
jgi:tetratricopeptide (TPR) repeat protein